MDNFIFGVGAIARGISQSLKGVSQYNLIWGFGLGFLVSTLVHGFIMSESPKDLPTVLFKDKMQSFQKISSQSEDGTYTKSFSSFGKFVDKVKLFFGVSFFIFAIVVLIAVLKF